jgi:hypothetical protein
LISLISIGALSSELATDPPFMKYVSPSNSGYPVASTQYACFLAGTGGSHRPDAWDSNVNLYYTSGNWYMSTIYDVWGRASCAGLGWFQSFSGGTDRWLSPIFNESAYALGGCQSNSAATWWGDAATGLVMIGGTWYGLGEFMRADQGATAWSPGSMNVQDCGYSDATNDGDWVYGHAVSLFVGTASSGHRAYFVRQNANGDDYITDDTTPYHLQADGHYWSMWMARTENALCYLTKVSGWWDSAYDYADIGVATRCVNGVCKPTWILKVNALYGDTVLAEARCYSRWQP